jgi:hypothetical protein
MKWAGREPDKIWKVRSKTHPTDFYKVELWGDGDLVCSCLYNYYKRKDCAHILKVRSMLAREKAERENAGGESFDEHMESIKRD